MVVEAKRAKLPVEVAPTAQLIQEFAQHKLVIVTVSPDMARITTS